MTRPALLAPVCLLFAACGDDSVVVDPVPTSIQVSPSPIRLGGPTDQVQLVATVRDQYGDAMSLSATFSSSSPAVASVTPAGLVTAVAVGGTQISATAARGSDTARVVVSTTVESPPVLAAGDLCSDNPPYAVGTFADAGLAETIVRTLGLSDPSELTCGRLATLTSLDASAMALGDVTGVQNLVAVTSLDLDDNAITVLAPLSTLTALADLSVRNNALTSSDGLQTLGALDRVDLRGNAGLADLVPLMSHAGLASGDSVLVGGTAADCTEAALVQAGGAAVVSECPALDAAIVFSTTRDGDREIYSMKLDGTDPVRLTDSAGEDEAPQWSPDGTKIAFMSERDGNWEIYVMDANGSDPVRLTDYSGSDRWPTWSPDGSKIAFIRVGGLWTMDADGSNQTGVITGLSALSEPSWSASDRIAVTAFVGDQREIYTLNPDGSDTVNVTSTPDAREFDPDWSADGSVISYSRVASPGDDVYRMNADGSAQTRLSTEGPNSYFTDWSPDGAWIVFSSNRRDQITDLYVMSADGSTVVRLGTTEAGRLGLYPSWRD